MGVVWQVRHDGLHTLFAAKFLIENDRGTNRLRFRREARLAARLQGAHVPRVFDLGEWRGLPYILMEHLDGEDLRRRLDRVGSLPPSEVLSLLAPVARVLMQAHGMGIVHRDLKPENLFLGREEGGEVVKVLDFGVAKVQPSGGLASLATRSGAVLGTTFYMSPEQLRGAREVDHHADLWALSVVIFEALTGQRPFQAEGLSQLIHQIESGASSDPLRLRPDLPPGFGPWWARASASDPAQRFPDAAALLQALARALDLPEPSFAPPATRLATPQAITTDDEPTDDGLLDDVDEPPGPPTEATPAGVSAGPPRPPRAVLPWAATTTLALLGGLALGALLPPGPQASRPASSGAAPVLAPPSAPASAAAPEPTAALSAGPPPAARPPRPPRVHSESLGF